MNLHGTFDEQVLLNRQGISFFFFLVIEFVVVNSAGFERYFQDTNAALKAQAEEVGLQ
jgi:hypothetical protein